MVSPQPEVIEAARQRAKAAARDRHPDERAEGRAARRVARGLGRTIFEGLICRREGHGRARYTSSGGCIVCAREAARRRDKRLVEQGKTVRARRPKPSPVRWWRPGWRAMDE